MGDRAAGDREVTGFVIEDRGYRTPCRVWTGAKRGSLGYGARSIDGRIWYVHRWEWTRAHGPIAPGVKILHRCDQPDCAELSHLFEGSQGDNVRDCVAKGRARFGHLPGERSGRSKLTAGQVRLIRTRDGLLREVAAEFGVSLWAIADIRKGRTWRSVT